MACFANGTMKGTMPEKTYTSESLRSAAPEDGTRIVTSPVTDIKRPVCAGIDVRKPVLMAAVCKTDPKTLSAVFYVRSFTSANSDIRRMADWIKNCGAQDVCMESAGKYRIPVYDILEQNCLNPVLTHPEYVKQAEGRKTDFRDAIHIANLFRMDLAAASFIPPSDIRDLRELCRCRLKLTCMRTSEKNRYQNSMTISRVRLDSVFSDPFGKSASSIMSCLVSTDPDEADDSEILRRVDRRVKASSEDIPDSIHGYEFIGVQRDKLQVIRKHPDDINECIGMIDAKLEHCRCKYAETIQHLVTMTGITEDSALYIPGEIGADMSVWRDSASLASWAGLAPAGSESAGKKKSAKAGKGGHYLKPLLVQCALAATKSTEKCPYFRYKYQTLKKRRGHRKAIIAIARKMLAAVYHMIRDSADFSPADYEDLISKNNKSKGLDLKNVIAFPVEHGADENTIRMAEAQCSGNGTEQSGGNTSGKPSRKRKQSKPAAETSARSEPKPARRKKAAASATTNAPAPSKQPVTVTA